MTATPPPHYEQFLNLNQQHHELNAQIFSLSEECQRLKALIQTQNHHLRDSLPLSQADKRKRHRRSAKQVERHFNCSLCAKSYG